MYCPWDRFPPATLEFCERLLNGWVRQPANTVSNIGFVIVGILLWTRTPPEKIHLRIFAIGSFLVGITSGIFHLSMTFVAQFFDVASMYLTAGVLVVLNAVRLGWLAKAQIYKALITMQILAMLLMFFFQGSVGEHIFSAQVAFIVFTEIWLMRRDRLPVRSYRWWIAATAAWGSATLVWVMDMKKIWCDADNHWLQGHAAWHLLSAAAVYFLYRYYDEIETVSASSSASSTA